MIPSEKRSNSLYEVYDYVFPIIESYTVASLSKEYVKCTWDKPLLQLRLRYHIFVGRSNALDPEKRKCQHNEGI